MKEQFDYLDVVVTLTKRVFEDGEVISNYSNLDDILDKASSPLYSVRTKETSYGGWIDNYFIYFLTEEEANAFYERAHHHSEYAKKTGLKRFSVGHPTYCDQGILMK